VIGVPTDTHLIYLVGSLVQKDHRITQQSPQDGDTVLVAQIDQGLHLVTASSQR
jgi:hypothetical protein